MPDSHSWDDLPVLLEGPGTQIRGFESHGMTATLIRLDAGADSRPLFTGLENDHCQIPHWGYVISGRLKLWLEDGSVRYFEPGELFVWDPGHAPAADVDTEYVELSPTDQYRELMAHAQRASQ